MAHRQGDPPERHGSPPTALPAVNTGAGAAPSSMSSSWSSLQGGQGTGHRSPKDSLSRTPSSPIVGHRASFADNLRGMPGPGSPRGHRPASLTQQALQELLNNPPVARTGPATFDTELSGRDWRTVKVGEVTDPNEVRWAEMETSVEDATNTLIGSGAPNVVLLRENSSTTAAIGTFDYNDLNAYLLLVVGLAQPDASHIQSFNELARKGREGKPIPLKEVKDLGRKEPLIMLPHTANLTKAVEVFGSGIHRIIIVKEHTSSVIGILTQLRLVRFFWENGRAFPSIEMLYEQSLKDLRLGSKSVIAINGDKPLSDALELMNNEGITSLPVLDAQANVIGNISHVDVRLLTKSTSLPLLRATCIHFISVILSERGIHDGKDSFPVFHVTPNSTLAHTIAKLVATKSHRMWVVDPPGGYHSPSPGSSGPSTPAVGPSSHQLLVPSSPSLPLSGPAASSGALDQNTIAPPPTLNIAPAATAFNPTPNRDPVSSSSSSNSGAAPTPPQATPPLSVSASALPGASISGRLSGVVSLTDILNLFARASGLSPHDPAETRRQRRRSSSSSLQGFGRRSVDSARSSQGDVSRSGSVRGRPT
ncbi:hypothetical protein BDY21DRAFT_338418 [Lineolata rhizophorae]|uniref:CBS domain-containing protein n=1 Tax=Lineolata rhizophorae TaxID=578093 RepID=A0A6A6P671_9PEZI|nr:hypothetical protein BDY21DRAFT_338418 [Lineolata rhizophorae]